MDTEFIIRDNDMLSKRSLKVDYDGVAYLASEFIGGTRKRFTFEQIDCILLSEKDELSLQVGNEVFKIGMDPNKKKDKQCLEALLSGVRRQVTDLCTK